MHVGIKNNHAKMNTTNTNKKIKLTEQKQISGREKKRNKGNKTERVSDGKKSDCRKKAFPTEHLQIS